MHASREEEHRRLIDLAANARECTGKLEDQLKLAERIVKTSELCRYVVDTHRLMCSVYDLCVAFCL
jgi:hypothetical protein